MPALAHRPSAHEARLIWLELVGAALPAAFAGAAGALTREGQTALARALIRARGCAFPVAYASAQALAKGFLEHASGLSCAARPEDQARLAPVVQAGAKGLSDLIAEAQADAASRTWMRQIPEADR